MQNRGIAGFAKEGTNQIEMPYADKLAILFLEVFEIDDCERFEQASKTAIQPLGSFGDTTHNSVYLGKKNYNSISFCEVVAFEDKTFAFVYRHPLGNKIQDPSEQKADTNELQEAFSGVKDSVTRRSDMDRTEHGRHDKGKADKVKEMDHLFLPR